MPPTGSNGASRSGHPAASRLLCRPSPKRCLAATMRRITSWRDQCPWLPLDLSRFDAAPLIAFTAAKETDYGNETDGRIPPRCGADRADERAYTQAGCVRFGCWPIDAEQVGDGAS